jgi:hypothetical protein
MTSPIHSKISQQLESLSNGYDGHQMAVQVLIEDVAAHLQQEFNQIPIWEASELDAARTYAKSNLLKVALAAAQKAMFVSTLSDDEYWGGYEYTHKNIARLPRHTHN